MRLSEDPRGDEDIVQDVALANLKRTLFGEAPPVQIGRYEVERVLGIGGMGIVYRARDPELAREVAIKVIPAGGDPESANLAQGRLVREAQALAKLQHENVLPVYDVGLASVRSTADLECLDVFVVAEYVDGPTLGDWLSSERRPVRVILDVFRQAAHGLAAAHSAGFVHRDFKPANVLLRVRDGETRPARVLVSDFGLVAAADAPEVLTTKERQPSSEAWSMKFSRTDGVLGTPGFLAPEAFTDEPVGPAADQYAYCVALWMALYDEHPFGGEQVPETPAFELRRPPPRNDVPSAVRIALERGLALEPSERWPSMHHLLDALDPSGKRWGPRVAGLAALLISGTAFGILSLRDDAPCSPDALQTAWNVDTRAALSDALAALDAPYAADSAQRVVRRLDGYAERWADGYQAACTGLAATKTASAEAKLLCYRQRLVDLRATVTALEETDASSLRNAVPAASRLRPLAACERDPSSAPAAPFEAETVEHVERLVARARALSGARRGKEAVPVANEAVELAADLDHAPTRLEAMMTLATAHRWAANASESARLYEEVFFEARAEQLDALALQAADGRVMVAQEERRIDDGREWVAHGRSIASAASVAEADRVRLERDAGFVELLAGDLELALSTLRDACSRAEATFKSGDNAVEVCRSYLAQALRDDGQLAVAVDMHRSVLSSRIVRLGPDHPDTASVRFELGHSLLRLGKEAEGLRVLTDTRERLEHGGDPLILAKVLTAIAWKADPPEARKMLARVLAIRVPALGPDHPNVSATQVQLGVFASEAGDQDEAQELLEAALAAEQRRLGPDHHQVANVHFHLGFVHMRREDWARAVASMRECLRILELVRGESHFDVARPLKLLARWTRDDAEAVAFAERAVRIVETTEADPMLRAYVFAAHAHVLRRVGAAKPRLAAADARASDACHNDRCREIIEKERL